MNRNTISQSIRPLLRWWWLIVAAAVVAGATSFVYVRSRPDIYASHATLMVGSAIRSLNPESSQLQMGAYLARNYAAMAQRSTLQDAAKVALGMQWLPEYTVDVRQDSPMIELAVFDSDPIRAQAVATEIVRQIVLLGPGGASAETRSRFAEEQLTKMEQDISATEAEIAKRQDDLASATSARQIVSLEDEVTALDTKLTSLRDSYTALLSSTREGAVNAINVVESPSLPALPESSSGRILVLLAVVMGGMLAAAGAYLLDFLDDSISGQQQVEETLNLTAVGTIPAMENLRGADEPAGLLVMHEEPHGAAAEAFRVLRTNVLFAAVDAPIAQLLITSPAPAEGKSTVAANLAVAMAQAGKRVILIDADLRRPNQHRIFELRNNAGLSSALLADERTLAGMIQKTAIPGLSVLTSGPLPPNPADLVGSARMASLLDTLKGLCDLLIVDTPPTNAVTDAAVLAARSDAVLLVLRAGYSGSQQAQIAATGLGHARARILGVVLNAASRSAHGYPYYRGAEPYGVYGLVPRTTSKPGGSSGAPARTTNAIARGRTRPPVPPAQDPHSSTQGEP